MEKRYEITVKIEWQSSVYAENIEKAVEIIKEQFEYEHNLGLKDDEIVNISLAEN